MDATFAVSISHLRSALAAFPPPQLLDVRRAAAFASDPVVISGGARCAPEAVAAAAARLEPWRPVYVYCAEGHDVGRSAAATLRERGHDARFLEGGLAAWRAAGGATEPHRLPTRWVTRERPKIDRIACPWLVRRFVDPSAEFFYVPAADVRAFARAHDATPYDIPDAEYGHDGPNCSFDAFIRRHALTDPALHELAAIVRGADTGVPGLTAQSPGLVATSLGLASLFADDQAMLRWGMLVYDALYAWCRQTTRHAARGDAHRTPRAA